MRVSCPACDAAYEIPDDVMAAGRRLRCARCANEWVPVAAEDPADLAPPPPVVAAKVEPTTEDLEPAQPSARPPPPLVASPPLIQDRAEPEPESRSAARVLAAWTLSVAILVGIAVAAYVFRETVQSAWPPSQLLYAALGLR